MGLGTKLLTTKQLSENLLAIEIKRTKVKMNKLIYLGMPILDISKTLMYKFWYDYMKPKYEDRGKLCYTYTVRKKDYERIFCT